MAELQTIDMSHASDTVMTCNATAAVASTTYYIGDVPLHTWWWPKYQSYPVYFPVPVRHDHEFEQVRSLEGGYEDRLFCRGCGDTKSIRKVRRG